MTTAAATTDGSPRERWEKASNIPLTVAAVAFLVAYAWPILDPSMADGTAGRVFELVTAAAWVAFVVDYAARFYLSQHRARFVVRNPFDLAAVLLPMLRPLRLLRLVTVLGVLNRHVGGSLRGRVVVYIIGSTTLLLFVASLAVLDAERDAAGASITTFGDALWWALTTVTTVGYGDHFPVTPRGRLVAAGLMIGGIALLGVVTATFASWLLDRVAEVEEESTAATQRDIRALTAEVAELRAALTERPERDAEP